MTAFGIVGAVLLAGFALTMLGALVVGAIREFVGLGGRHR
ncbi:hypothetical protein GCM10027589_02930 [Actinocorallia lasiicapitis]